MEGVQILSGCRYSSTHVLVLEQSDAYKVFVPPWLAPLPDRTLLKRSLSNKMSSGPKARDLTKAVKMKRRNEGIFRPRRRLYLACVLSLSRSLTLSVSRPHSLTLGNR